MWPRCSLLLCAGAAKNRSLTSNPWSWWIELVIEEVLVDDPLMEVALLGTRDGVALRVEVPKVDALLRSRTLRDRDGNLLSSLLLKLGEGSSPDRLLLTGCESESVLRTSHAS